jgi:hypothetical protein
VKIYEVQLRYLFCEIRTIAYAQSKARRVDLHLPYLSFKNAARKAPLHRYQQRWETMQAVAFT